MTQTLENNLGFSKNPFSKRSSEQELDFINEIFYEPNYYDTLKRDLISGDTSFIIGQRGHGKTSVINKLYDDLNKIPKVFIFKVDRFEDIPIDDNEKSFLLLLIKQLVHNLVVTLVAKKDAVKRLSAYQKDDLAFFVTAFFRPISNSEYVDAYDKIKKVKWKNRLSVFFNKYGIHIANVLASGFVEITSDMARKSLGLNGPSGDQCKEYFSKIDVFTPTKDPLAENKCTIDELKKILDKIYNIYNTLGYERVIVLFDKIDEYKNLNHDISIIANFARSILSDTELLMNERLAIGFSLWSELKSELSGYVRFDKFGTIDVRWIDEDMIPLIDKRLRYFSVDKGSPVKFSSLIKYATDQQEIIELANKSPRDLIYILSEILKEQANRRSDVTELDDKAIRKGMIAFCKEYDYSSLIPTKAGKNKDIKSTINKLLSMRHVRFTQQKLEDGLNLQDHQALGYIRQMVNFGFIREEEILSESGKKIYEIIDPKIAFMIKHQVGMIE